MRSKNSGATNEPTGATVLDATTRRAKVQQMAARGMSQGEMARVLGVDRSTVARDLKALEREAKMVHSNGKVRV